MIRWLFTVVVACAMGAQAATPLVLEGTIALPGTNGRIDHMAIDVTRKRLIIAELGNGTVDVVDLSAKKVIHRISGLKEPQGVAYAPKADVLLVAGGGDGVVRLYGGADYAPRGEIHLGDDADNAHLDSSTGHVLVGYGEGGLADVDPAKGVKLLDIPLPAHPEGFVISPASGHITVNVPDADQIIDIDAHGSRHTWRLPEHWSSNFPIGLAGDGHVAAVFRSPAKLALYGTPAGIVAASADTCGDADDVFFDAKRQQLYVSCGADAIDTFRWDGKTLAALGRVTSSGARTSLFVPEFDRLYVAARAGWFGTNASIQIYRPQP